MPEHIKATGRKQPQTHLDEHPRPASEPPSLRHEQLEGPSGLSGRPQSARLHHASHSRPRVPLGDIGPSSPQSLLGNSARSDDPSFSARFTEIVVSHQQLPESDVPRPIDSSVLQLEGPGAANEPSRPGRSWQSVGEALLGGMTQVGQFAHRETVGMAVDLGRALAQLPGARWAGAVAGHFIHQTVAVGMSTLAREMIGMGFAHLMRAEPASTIIGVQAAMAGANLAMQGMREFRERRNPDEAARAYHSLTADQWAAASPERQEAMRAHTRAMSRMFTLIQVASSATNLAMVSIHARQADPNSPQFVSQQTAALQPLVNDVKVAVYATLRDTAQASFSMVAIKAGPSAEAGWQAPEGVSGAAEAGSAIAYSAFYGFNGYLSPLLKQAMVPEAGTAAATLMGAAGTGMSTSEAWGHVAASASISAMLNVMPETMDWMSRTEMMLHGTGGIQQLEPALTGTDYGRLLDQMPGRAAYFNGLFSALTLGGEVMNNMGVSADTQAYIGNVGSVLIMIALDSPTMGLWQAAGAVRNPPSAPSNVRISELTEGETSDRSEEPSSGEISGQSGSSSHRVSAGFPFERHLTPGNSPHDSP